MRRESPQEANLALERQWRVNIVGTPPTELSHLQISALAGEFYRSTVAAHIDEPGRSIDWQGALIKHARRRRPIIGPLGQHLRGAFGGEAGEFLRTRGINLVGDRFEMFVRAYVDAKEHASRTLMRAAERDYTVDQKAKDYPEFVAPDPKREFEALCPFSATPKCCRPSPRKSGSPISKP